MTAVAATSREAYHSLTTRETQQHRILEALAQYGPLSDAQLSEKANVPTHLVPARRGELVKAELVRCAGLAPVGAKGMNVQTWELSI